MVISAFLLSLSIVFVPLVHVRDDAAKRESSEVNKSATAATALRTKQPPRQNQQSRLTDKVPTSYKFPNPSCTCENKHDHLVTHDEREGWRKR